MIDNESPWGRAARLKRLRVRDLILNPARVVADVRALAAFAERAHSRSMEAMFFSNDTAKNRLGRDGFFDAVAAVRASRARTPRTAGRVMASEWTLRLDFMLLPGEDVEKWGQRLVEVVSSLEGDYQKSEDLVEVERPA